MIDPGRKAHPVCRRILVLGACGFSGRFFLDHIADLGLEIHTADRNSSSKSDQPSMHSHVVDLTQPKLLWTLLESISPHYVVNFVGLAKGENFAHFYKGNVAITEEVLEWAAGPGADFVNKVLLIGSCAEYGVPHVNPITEDAKLEPVNFYGLSKAMQTKLAKFYATRCAVPVVIARPFNIYDKEAPANTAVGDWQRKIGAATDGDAIHVGNLQAERDYISAKEAVGQYLKILLKGEPGEVYNVCSGKPLKMRSLLESMIRESGKNISICSDSQAKNSPKVLCIYGDAAKFKSLG